jgi:hypothetical protein
MIRLRRPAAAGQIEKFGFQSALFSKQRREVVSHRLWLYLILTIDWQGIFPIQVFGHPTRAKGGYSCKEQKHPFSGIC